MHAVDVDDGETICPIGLTVPENVAWRIVAVQHLLVVHVGGEQRKRLGQRLILLRRHLVDLVEAVGIGALHADEEAQPQQSAVALLEISHGFGRPHAQRSAPCRRVYPRRQEVCGEIAMGLLIR